VALRLGGLGDLDPTAVPLPPGTEVITRVERMVDGESALLLDPGCMILRAGFARGYAYPKIAASGGTRYADRPAKDRYSHPHDALQYLVIGAGVGHQLITRPGPPARPVVAQRGPPVWARFGGNRLHQHRR